MNEKTLAKIDAALKELSSGDQAKNAALAGLLKEIKAELQGARPAAARARSRALGDAVRAFEASHPKLVVIVESICGELSSLGI